MTCLGHPHSPPFHGSSDLCGLEDDEPRLFLPDVPDDLGLGAKLVPPTQRVPPEPPGSRPGYTEAIPPPGIVFPTGRALRPQIGLLPVLDHQIRREDFHA